LCTAAAKRSTRRSNRPATRTADEGLRITDEPPLDIVVFRAGRHREHAVVAAMTAAAWPLWV